MVDIHTHPKHLHVDQVRQHVPHKRTFFYLEQLILKHKAHENTTNVKSMHEVRGLWGWEMAMPHMRCLTGNRFLFCNESRCTEVCGFSSVYRSCEIASRSVSCLARHKIQHLQLQVLLLGGNRSHMQGRDLSVFCFCPLLCAQG